MAIICQCGPVRDRAVLKAIHRGATTLADVQDACGAAMQCGGCEPAIRELIARETSTVVRLRDATGVPA